MRRARCRFGPCRSKVSFRQGSPTARPSAHASRAKRPPHSVHRLHDLQLRGLLPDVVTYSAAISPCEKGQKQPQRAKHRWHDWQLRGLLQDVVTYSVAISPCEKGPKQPQRAMHRWQAAGPRPTAGRGHPPRGHQRMREGPGATGSAAIVAGVRGSSEASCRKRSSTTRPSAQEGRPSSAEGAACVARVAALRSLAKRDH